MASVAMSILNARRHVLPGPLYLDEICSGRDLQHTAILYTTGTGQQTEYSYAQLKLLARALCQRIRHRFEGTTLPSIVPVMMPQCPELYVSYLAVLYAGHGFCPITPDTPLQRVQFILQDVNAALVLCLPQHSKKMSQELENVECMEVSLANLGQTDPCSVSRILQSPSRCPTDVAYVMYTSGSTGKPKGVPISHRSVTQSLLAHDEHIPTFKRFLQFASPTFDVSIFEIFFPWYRGATLVSCAREAMLEDLPTIINELDIDAVELTPSVATTLLRTRSAVPGLELLMTIGEMLTQQVVQEFGGSEGRTSLLYAMYGPTEAAIHCTVVPKMSADSSTRNIGRPLATVTALVLSITDPPTDSQIVPIGEIGELAIAGQLAQGYLNRAEQTTAAFVHMDGYGMVYRTGDKARIRSDRAVEIMGRIADGQVKLRGQRIELGEVESVVLRTTGLSLAAAVVIENSMVVFCACSGTRVITTSQVQDQCRAWLPRHMLPDDIVMLQHDMPILPSGKIDRLKLRHIYVQNVQAETPQSLADGAVDTGLANLLSNLMGTTIDPRRSLRSQGLDSLKAISLTSKLRQDYPSLTSSMLLEAISLSHLAKLVNEASERLLSSALSDHSTRSAVLDQPTNLRALLKLDESPAHVRDGIVEVFACSDMQTAMLSETSRDPELNINQIILRCDANVPSDSVIEALHALSIQCDMLRSAFMETLDSNVPFVRVVRRKVDFHGTCSPEHPLTITTDSSQSVISISIHHALYDGWSWDALMHDLNETLRKREISPRPPFETFRQIQQTQHELYSQEDLAYWTTTLQDVELSTFPNLTTTKIAHMSRVKHTVQSSVKLESLNIVALDLDVSRPAIVHTALCILLSFYTGSQDVLTGLITSGRDIPMQDVEHVIGPCLTTLPSVARLDAKSTLGQSAIDIHEHQLRALGHSRVSLTQIKAGLRNTTHEALFDVLYVWQESPWSNISQDVAVVVQETHDQLDYALVLEVTPSDSALLYKVNFDGSRVSDTDAEIFAKQLDYILEKLLRTPDLTLDKLWESCPTQLLAVSNVHATAHDDRHDITDTICRLAVDDASRVAIEFVIDYEISSGKMTKQTVTYGELYERSQSRAKHLLSNYQFDRDDVICIWAQKSLELYITLCATMTAGLAYLCIDPSTPLTRVLEVLKQANCKLVLLDNTTVQCASELRPISTACIGQDTGSCDKKIEVPVIGSNQTDLAYAVLTSGSTGVPKAVLVTRSNLYSNIEALEELYPHDKTSRLLQSCSPAFDVSVFEIFWTWHCGMTLCGASNDVLFRDVNGFISRMNISHLSMTPSVAALIDRRRLDCVKFLVCAGEPMSAKVFDEWVDHGLWQGYGPSETTNVCNVRGEATKGHMINNVGRALSNTSIFVCSRLTPTQRHEPLDLSAFRPLPLGTVGEIWIGGSQVGRGYTNPDLTGRSWLEHPDFGRLYKSGDVGRLLADRSLVVLGRQDDQVKIRGQRIELNEISSQILHLGIVPDAVTMIVCDTSGRDSLVSFWTHRGHQDEVKKTIDKVFDHLRGVLPSYMVPEMLVPVDGIPLTRQGKVDKQALTNLFVGLTPGDRSDCTGSTRSEAANQYFTETETKVAEAVSAVSGIPVSDLASHMSLYSYGIDSIRAIALARQLQTSGDHNVAVSTVLKHFSIGRLANALRSNQHRTIPEHCLPEATTRICNQLCESTRQGLEKQGLAVVAVYPCTPLQQAMLITSASESTSYVNHLVYQVYKHPDIVTAAWRSMIKRHQILRTVFARTEDGEHPVLQIVLANWELSWSECSPGENPTIPDPFTCPAYKFGYERAAGSVKLHLYMHHALYDAEALNLLQQEFEARVLDKRLPATVPFSKYLVYANSQDKAVSDEFWSHTLQKVKSSRLANTCAPRTGVSSTHSCAYEDVNLESGNILDLVRSNSISLLSLLQASLARFLAGRLHTSDVCFGTVYSGRNIDLEDANQIVGPCFNTLPVCLDVLTTRTNLDLCYALQQFNTDVLPFQSTSLRDLQRKYGSDGKSLFDVILLFQAEEQVLDHKVWRLESEHGMMNFPFIFEIQSQTTSGKLVMRLHSTVTDTVTMRDLLRIFVDELKYVTGRLRHRVAEDLHLSADTSTKPHINGRAVGEREPPQSREPLSATDQVSRDVVQAISELRKDPSPSVALDLSIHKLGLDSIHAAQLAAKLKRLGYQISMAEILARPKIRDIIEICRALQSKTGVVNGTKKRFDLDAFERLHREAAVQRLMLSDHDLEAVLPCTATQSGILSEHIHSGGVLYQNSMTFQLGEGIDIIKLKACWVDAQRQHAILRTGFIDVQDKARPYAMLVWAADRVSLPWYEPDSPIRKNELHVVHDYDPACLARPCWQLETYVTADGRYLKMSMLHALYDAISIRFILSNVASRYQGRTTTHAPRFADALEEILEGNELKDSSKEFWQSVGPQLQPTCFPNLHICRQVPSKMLVEKILMTASLDDLNRRCAELDTTLWTSCQLVWAQLLRAYTGQECVTFGTVLSGRAFESEGLAGVCFPCINTLPVCVNLVKAAPQIRQDIQDYNAELQKHPQTSLASIRRYLKIDDVLFDTLLVLQAFDAADNQDGFWQIDCEEANAEFTVSLEILPHNDQLELRLTYNTAVVPPEQGRTILAQFRSRLSESIALSSSLERNEEMQAVVPARNTVIPSDSECLHDMVLDQAMKTPNDTALEFVLDLHESGIHRQTWSYQDLIVRANQIAHLLIQHGASTGELIGISFDKCPEAAFALLGVLVAGCAYVAIDPDAPLARKQFILNDAKCRILLTMESLHPTTAFGDLVILELDDAAMLDKLPGSAPKVNTKVTGESTCYCLYTSGTTGTPKGCLISHKSAVQAMLSFSRIFDGRWTGASKWLQFAAYHFDVSVLEHFWSWSVGICVTVVPRDLLFEDLPATIAKLGITHIDLTPSLARMLSPELVPSLRGGVFVVGGEQVRQEIIETWGDAGCLYNFYGPSEVTIGCTVHPRVAKNIKPTNIGRQWENVNTYVMRPGTEEPVLIGEIGELCVGGVLVGQGYLNRPDLTNDKFVRLEQYGDRVYRTGDLVRMLHDQSFEFLGRIDDQVKLRGQRLEIGEIDTTALLSDDNLRGATTLVVKHDTQNREQLVMFLTRAPIQNRANVPLVIETSPEALELASRTRKFMSDRLPAYMIPSQIFMVNFLPLTANNKVDTKSLRALHGKFTPVVSGARHESKHDHGIPDEYMNRVKDIIADYSGIDSVDVGPDSTLFELGVDSVSVIGLSRAFKAAAVTSANVKLLMRHSRVCDLARVLFAEGVLNSDDSRNTEAARAIRQFADRHLSHIAEVLDGQNLDIVKALPCTPLQEGIIARMLADDSDRPQYLNVFVYKLDQDVNLGGLAEAWTMLCYRLEILRTHFVSTEDGFAQVVVRSARSQVVETIQCLDTESELQKTIDRIYQGWQAKARQLVYNETWTVKLLHDRTSKQSYMVILMFHALYDGVSLPLLLEQLYKIYEGDSTVDEARPSFQDVLAQGTLQTGADAHLFWQQKRRKAHVLSLQNGEYSPQPHCAIRRVHLPELSSIVMRLGVSYQAVFQAVWSLCLMRHFDQSPLIGTVVSGRAIDVDSADTIIGPMFNTLPLCLRGLAAESILSDLVKACHEFNVDVLPYQHTPLSSIKKWWNFHSKQELFDSLFVYQSRPASTRQLPWQEIKSEAVADYPLSVEVERDDKSYRVTIVAQNIIGHPNLTQTLADSMVPVLLNLSDALTQVIPSFVCEAEPVRVARDQNKSSPRKNGAGDENLTPIQMKVQKQIADLASTSTTAIQLYTPNLFELGLDSIDALKLVVRLKRVELSIKVSKILQHATLAGISQHCDVIRQANGHLDIPYAEEQGVWQGKLIQQDADVGDIQMILPVTPMQESLLLKYEQYFRISAYALASSVNIEGFIQAVNDTMRDLPILRTRFSLLESNSSHAQFLQIVHKFRTYENGCTTRALTNVDDLKSYIRQRYNESGLQTSMPCCEIISVRKMHTKFFVLSMSHAHFDAWSIQAVHREILARYERKATSRSDLADISRFVKRVRNTSKDHSTASFWTELTRDLCATNIMPSVDVSGPIGLRLTSRLPQSVLLEACKHYGVTMQSMCLTAWSLTLVHLTRQLDICFGMVVSGRVDDTTENLIFPTFNTVIFRPRHHSEHNTKEVLQHVQKTANEMLEQQYFPLSSAIRLAGQARNNLFNTLFTFQRPTEKNTGTALYEEFELESTSVSPPYAVNIEVGSTSKTLVWTLAAQENIVSAKQAHRLLEVLDHILSRLVSPSTEHVLHLQDSKLTIFDLPTIDIKPVKNVSDMRDSNGTAQSWSQTELKVQQIFSEISGVDTKEINRNTNIFGLGLDSISAIRISSALRKINLKAPVSLILKQQSIANISAALTTYDSTKAKSGVYAANHTSQMISLLEPTLIQKKISSDQIEAIYPATAGQVYMLDMYLASEGRLHYNEFWFEVQASKALDLESAFLALTRSISILRTCFVQHERRMYQVLFKVDIDVVQHVAWQYRVVRTPDGGENTAFVVLKIHHALYDAVSIGLLRTALAAVCSSATTHVAVGHDMRPFLAQTEPLEEAAALARKDFWTTYLGAASSESSARTAGTFTSLRTTRFERKLIPANPLQAFARIHSITVQSLFFAIVARLYSTMLHGRSQGHVVIGIYLANRSLDIDNLETLTAPTISIVPLKINLDINPGQSLVQIAREIQADLVEISRAEHCGVSLRDIYTWTGVRIDCYVNFVRIPESSSSPTDSNMLSQSTGENVLVKPTAARPDILSATSSETAPPAPIINAEQVAPEDIAWCLPSLDIEARLDGHGWLQTGIFVPRGKADDQAVDAMMQELKSSLMGVCGLKQEDWERERRVLEEV